MVKGNRNAELGLLFAAVAGAAVAAAASGMRHAAVQLAGGMAEVQTPAEELEELGRQLGLSRVETEETVLACARDAGETELTEDVLERVRTALLARTVEMGEGR